MRQTLSTLGLVIGTSLLFGCNAGSHRSVEGVQAATIDLNHIAPIGYEICAGNPPQLSPENVDLKLRMPNRIEIPTEQQTYGAKALEFRAGQHEVDLYKDLRSPRLLFAKGNIAIEEGVPTMHAKLQMARLPKGKYVLGISGDPFFAYCTINLQ